VVSLLRSEWAFFPPERPSDCIRAIRGTCKAWQSTVDADVQAVAATVPLAAPAALALRLPNVTALDLSRYPRNCMELSPMLQHLRLRSLVLADPWDPPAAIPVQWLGALTHLSLLADGMVVGRLAAQLCQALGKLQQLRHLQLSRLQLSTPAAQMLAQAFGDLPHLSHVQLSGGAAPVQGHDLHELLNGERVRRVLCGGGVRHHVVRGFVDAAVWVHHLLRQHWPQRCCLAAAAVVRVCVCPSRTHSRPAAAAHAGAGAAGRARAAAQRDAPGRAHAPVVVRRDAAQHAPGP
jgi:hypothetical protein